MRPTLVLPLTLAALALALSSASAQDEKPLSYTTSWYGNTFGAAEKWVQMAAEAMFVAADGTCYLNCFWDEAGREVGMYRDGDVVGIAGHTHGWGYNGGHAVTANDQYLFIAQVVDNEGGGLQSADTWPPKGKVWNGVSRRLRDGQPASFPGGKGGSGDTLRSSYLLLDETDGPEEGRITGLAADATRLYVAGGARNRIQVVDIATMTVTQTWSVPRPGPLCLGRHADLWAIQAPEKPGERGRVIHLAATGQVLPEVVADVANPSAIALDPQGRLLVADNGPDQQVKAFRVDGEPEQASALGVRCGLLAGAKGRVGPLRFNDIRGVGADAKGNVYVCCNGNGLGMVLESYAPSGERTWQLLGLEFVDVGDLDPSNEADLYTQDSHYRMDWTQPGGGREWRFVGYTLNRWRYPNDPRNGHAQFASTWVRRLRGQLLLFGVDMYSHNLLIYRKGPDELFVPSGLLVNAPFDAWPPHQPADGAWIWRDANGSGDFDEGEFQANAEKLSGGWGWWVDADGDVWHTNGANEVVHLPFQGLDGRGNPVYAYDQAAALPHPEPLTQLERVEYYPATDTMYLSGYSAEQANTHGNWKTIGKVLCRYDHWSTRPTKTWEVHPPFEEAQERADNYGTPVAMRVEGDYVFIVYLKTAEVRVLSAQTGDYVGTMRPGKDTSGWVDIPYGINIHRRATGEYIVLVEEDWKAKGTIYRWEP
jgi:hypothetical protein